MECMYRIKSDYMPCRPNAPTWNSYWPVWPRRTELVLRPDPKLPVRASEVELSEEASSPGLIHQLVHVWQRLDRPLRDGIEP